MINALIAKDMEILTNKERGIKYMNFKEYMNNVTGTYMVFIDEGKTVNINLTNINYIRDYLLETKDKKKIYFK